MKSKEFEYLKVLEELKNSVNVLLEGFYDLNKELKKKKKTDLSRQFSMINLPSRGVYYSNKKKSLLIRYLTAVEEHVLVDSFLVETGKGIELVLENVIMDEINIRDLLLSDFQAILIFLRSTAYGDLVEFNSVCPFCGKEGEQDIRLSELEFKSPKNNPNEDGKYVLYLPELDLEFVISPMTLEKEMQKIENESDEDYFQIRNEDGILTKIRKDKTLGLVYNIDSINGIVNKEEIKRIVKKLPKKHFDSINNFIIENEVGVNEEVNLKCPSCGQDFVQKIYVGYNFISLPANYKEIIYEECFLLNHYGKSVTRADVMSMPAVERKWAIRRIKEEMDKKSEAEKKAMSKAKASKGKF